MTLKPCWRLPYHRASCIQNPLSKWTSIFRFKYLPKAETPHIVLIFRKDVKRRLHQTLSLLEHFSQDLYCWQQSGHVHPAMQQASSCRMRLVSYPVGTHQTFKWFSWNPLQVASGKSETLPLVVKEKAAVVSFPWEGRAAVRGISLSLPEHPRPLSLRSIRERNFTH